ncbi:MAG: hypothetical protein CM1200mP29_04000 [Verrucomicrobiota bacterium]|nr:MAG: hypothetical protein CM1200mP29_04000 [Verrucomicrobiota bacterium]
MQMLPVLLALDEDGDGEISNDEIEKAEEVLVKLDKNGDGKLTGGRTTAKPGPKRPGVRWWSSGSPAS